MRFSSVRNRHPPPRLLWCRVVTAPMFYADTDRDSVRIATKSDPSNAMNYCFRAEDAAWVQVMHIATCRCASSGTRAQNARAELRKLEEESLKSAERLAKIMDEMPWSARQFREKALADADSVGAVS